MKTIDFSAVGMSTDVPRPLSGASVAVRNIFVPYGFVPREGGAASFVGAGDGVDAVVPKTTRDSKRKVLEKFATPPPLLQTHFWLIYS